VTLRIPGICQLTLAPTLSTCHVFVLTAVDTTILPYNEPLLNKIKLIQTKKLNVYCEIELQGHMNSTSVFQILRMALVVSHLLMCYMQRRLCCNSYVLCANKRMILLMCCTFRPQKCALLYHLLIHKYLI